MNGYDSDRSDVYACLGWSCIHDDAGTLVGTRHGLHEPERLPDPAYCWQDFDELVHGMTALGLVFSVSLTDTEYTAAFSDMETMEQYAGSGDTLMEAAFAAAVSYTHIVTR